MGNFLQELLEDRTQRRVKIVKPGSISHVDQNYSDTDIVTGKKEGCYCVIDPIAHRKNTDLASQVYFEQKRLLMEALRERGVTSYRQIQYGDWTETPHLERMFSETEPSLEEACEGYSEVIFHPVNPNVAYLNHDASI